MPSRSDTLLCVQSAAADPVAQLIGSIGTGDFAASYQAFAQRRLGVSRCHVFSFVNRSRPVCVLAQSNSAAVSKVAQSLASDYIGGDYHMDPLLRRLEPAQGLWVTANYPQQPCGGYFRAKYYEHSRIAEEISILGRVRDRVIYAGLCRQEDEPAFSDAQVQLIHANAATVVSSIERHLEVLTLAQPQPAALQGDPGRTVERRRVLFVRVRDALLDCNRGITAREAEICAYIAQGYFVTGIGQMLGISANTVATHRKRAYRKLGISRQNELFTSFINLLL